MGGYYQMKKCIRGFVMHYRTAEIKEENTKMDYLKHKQKASNNNKRGNLCRTLFLKPTLKMVQQEKCCRKYININRTGNKITEWFFEKNRLN